MIYRTQTNSCLQRIIKLFMKMKKIITGFVAFLFVFEESYCEEGRRYDLQRSAEDFCSSKEERKKRWRRKYMKWMYASQNSHSSRGNTFGLLILFQTLKEENKNTKHPTMVKAWLTSTACFSPSFEHCRWKTEPTWSPSLSQTSPMPGPKSA